LLFPFPLLQLKNQTQNVFRTDLFINHPLSVTLVGFEVRGGFTADFVKIDIVKGRNFQTEVWGFGNFGQKPYQNLDDREEKGKVSFKLKLKKVNGSNR